MNGFEVSCGSARLLWACLYAAAIPGFAQTVRLTVSGVPASATSVAIIADGGGFTYFPIARQDFTAGTTGVTFNIGVPTGGPYQFRAIAFVAEAGYSAALSTGRSTVNTVSLGVTVDAALSLSPLVVSLDPSTPPIAALGSPITLRVNCIDSGGLIATKRADFLTGPDGASGTGYFGTADWIWTGSTYTAALTAVMPASGTMFSFRASTPLITLNIGTPTVVYLYAPSLSRSGFFWQIPLAPGGTIRVTLQSVPATATGIAVLVDGGLLTTPLVTAADITAGTTSLAIDVGVVAGGPYRVRAAAYVTQSGFGSLLRSGQTSVTTVNTGTLVTATVALSTTVAALDPSTPATATHSQSVNIRVNVTDPGDLLENKRTDFLTGSDGASGTGYFGQSNWVRSAPTVYQALLTTTMPSSGTIFYFRSSTPLFTVTTTNTTPVYLFAPSLDRYGAGWQILLSVDATIHLTINSIPANANSIAILVDGGLLTTALITRQDFVPGTASTIVHLGVVSGATYRLRAVAFVAGGTVSSALATGKSNATVSSPGAAVNASVALSPLSVQLDAATPSMAVAGSSVLLRFNVTDAGDVLEGCGANFLTGADSASMDGFIGSAGLLLVASSTYQATLSTVLPAAGSVFAFRAGITLFALNSTTPTTVFVFAPILDRYAAPWLIALTPNCTYTFAPPSASVGSSSGSSAVVVTASQSSCSWNASSSAGWLIIDAGAPAAGSGTLTYTFLANSSTQPRTANLTIGGRIFEVTQAGLSSSIVLDTAAIGFNAAQGTMVMPSSQTVSVSGQPTQIAALSVTALGVSGGNWLQAALSSSTTPATLTVSLNGVAVSALPVGNYLGTVYVSSSQASNSPRTISVTLTVGPCSYLVTPDSLATVSGLGESRTITVTSLAGCTWVASTSAPAMIAFPFGTSGGGNGVVRYNIVANPGTQPRTGAITVAGRTFQLTQSGNNTNAPPATDSVSPVTAVGALQTFTLTFSDPNGWSNITSAQALWNFATADAGSQACYMEILPPAGQIRLRNDAGNDWLGPATIGQSTTLENSQCVLLLAGSQLSGSGTFLIVSIAIQSKSSFSGKKRLYMTATDIAGASSGWSLLAEWWPQGVTGVLVNRYRLYNPYFRAHLHTTDLNEYNVLGTRGYIQEGISGKMLDGPGSVNGVAGVPLYRLYYEPGKRHFWTADRNEYVTLIKYRGMFFGEGSDGFILPSQAPGSIPLYRVVHRYEVPLIHHWTTDAYEYFVLGQSGGWIQEGVAGYMMPR